MELNDKNCTIWNTHPIAFEIWTDEREKKREEISRKPYKWIQESLRPDLFNTLWLEENEELKKD